LEDPRILRVVISGNKTTLSGILVSALGKSLAWEWALKWLARAEEKNLGESRFGAWLFHPQDNTCKELNKKAIENTICKSIVWKT